MLFPWFDVDAVFAEANARSKQIDALLGHRGLDGRHGLRSFESQRADTLVEAADAWSWSADLPGVGKEQLSITVEDGQLAIWARREANTGIAGATERYLERRPYEFRRTFSLPQNIDPEGISATIEHGVLTVRLPKREPLKARQIEVQAA